MVCDKEKEIVSDSTPEIEKTSNELTTNEKHNKSIFTTSKKSKIRVFQDKKAASITSFKQMNYDFETSKFKTSNKLKQTEQKDCESKRSYGNRPFKLIDPDTGKIKESKIFSDDTEVAQLKQKFNDPISNSTTNTYKNVKTETIINKGKWLTLEVIESLTIKNGTIIVIKPEGMEGSKRNSKDGRIFFGTYSGTDQYQINDYTFPTEERGMGKRHFSIEYNLVTENYFLKDLGDGTGTFIKIDGKYTITTDIIISFNTFHISISLSSEVKSSFENPIKELDQSPIKT